MDINLAEHYKTEEGSNRIGPKTGFEANTTTAFCTIERVTSGSFTNKVDDDICRLHLDIEEVTTHCAISEISDVRNAKNSGRIGTRGNKVKVRIIFNALRRENDQQEGHGTRGAYQMSAIRKGEEGENFYDFIIIEYCAFTVLNSGSDLDYLT
jgi:hypothetical protein